MTSTLMPGPTQPHYSMYGSVAYSHSYNTGVGVTGANPPERRTLPYPPITCHGPTTHSGVISQSSVDHTPVGCVSSLPPTQPTQSGAGLTPAASTMTTTTTPENSAPLPAWTAATLPLPVMGQIPQIPCFTGEGRATGDSFVEWHEHFENVAKLAGWNDHWKLVHLTSNLRDTAMAFYRSCVRGKYILLVAAMKRRFMPIRLTAVQAQLFHNRQQQERETEDQFAQDLQKLFYNLAYAGATSEGPQVERMG